MWCYQGKIEPQPGESIRNAARQAVAIAIAFDARGESQFFEFTFNGVRLQVQATDSAEDVVERYLRECAQNGRT